MNICIYMFIELFESQIRNHNSNYCSVCVWPLQYVFHFIIGLLVVCQRLSPWNREEKKNLSLC